MSQQANRRSRSEQSEDIRDIRRQGTLGVAPLINYLLIETKRATALAMALDVEIRRFELLTSCLQSRRSTS